MEDIVSIIQKLDTPHGTIYVEVVEGDFDKIIDSTETDIALPKDAEPTGFKDFVVDPIQALKSNISAVAKNVQEALVSVNFEEFSIEINIGFKGTTRPIPVIVSGATEASLKIVAKWKKKD